MRRSISLRPGGESHAPGSGELIPLELMFSDPQYASPQVAPDGSRVAWIAPHGAAPNIWVQTIGADDARPVTHETGRGVSSHLWWPDSARLGYLTDPSGREDFQLHDVDLATGRIRTLTPAGARAEFIDTPHGITDRVMIGLNERDPRMHDVYELDLQSGEVRLVLENPGFTGFVADHGLQVRAALMMHPDSRVDIMVRDPGPDAVWRRLLECGTHGAMPRLLGFDQDGTRLLALTSAGCETTCLVWLDLDSGAVQTVADDPAYDVVDAVLARVTNTPQLVAVRGERMRWHALTPHGEQDLHLLTSVDDGDLVSLSRSRDDEVWVAGYVRDDAPTRYYLIRRAERRARLLFVDRPDLAAIGLAPMEPFSYTARDGLRIHAYASFPPGRDRVGLPTVVLVHGGPWNRDVWGSTRRCSSSPTGDTWSCSHSFAARWATARSSTAPATASGVARCRTTWSKRYATSSRPDTPTRRPSPCSGTPTAATRRWPPQPSSRGCSVARWL